MDELSWEVEEESTKGTAGTVPDRPQATKRSNSKTANAGVRFVRCDFFNDTILSQVNQNAISQRRSKKRKRPAQKPAFFRSSFLIYREEPSFLALLGQQLLFAPLQSERFAAGAALSVPELTLLAEPAPLLGQAAADVLLPLIVQQEWEAVGQALTSVDFTAFTLEEVL